MVRLTPSTSQPPQLVSVPRAECLVLPTCTVYVCCPFPPVIHHWYLHLLFVPAYLPPHVIFLSPVILWCLVSDQVDLFACKGKGIWCMHSLSVARPIPCPPLLIGHAGAGFHDSIGFCRFQCLKHLWIYLQLCGYIF